VRYAAAQETPPLSPVVEVRLVLGRELRRSIRSAKGIVIGALTLLGAFVASLVCVWIEASDRGGASAQAFAEMRRQYFEKQTGDPVLAAHLATIPASLLAFLKITIWLVPLLVALLGFDAISGELQQRTVRYWTVRSRRGSYFVGKLLGLWTLVGVVILVLNLLAGGVALVRGFLTLGELVGWGVRLWFVAFAISGVWAAIATFISSCFRTPMVALLTTFAAFFVLWIIGLRGFFSRMSPAGVTQGMSWYEYFYPNAYDVLLLHPDAIRVLTALGILVAGASVIATAGSVLIERRDI
jgi:ABC-type transport system involved in multi-copper enzyme maturation permease subunit